MASKRELDEPSGSKTKKVKQESERKKMEDDDFKYYAPDSIFNDNNKNNDMTGRINFQLAQSFFHSRSIGKKRESKFNRNAGAAQLYNKDGVTLFKIPGQKEDKEYNFVSYGNKEFKSYTETDFKNEKSAYGHSERVLMKMILDDLISGDGDSKGVKRPSHFSNKVKNEYEILKNLTENAHKYREYLEKKNVIVKMWSERPSCLDGELAGNGCSTFTKEICPAGSKFGYIVKDYKREDNNGPKVRNAFEEFRRAYLKYKKSSKDTAATKTTKIE